MMGYNGSAVKKVVDGLGYAAGAVGLAVLAVASASAAPIVVPLAGLLALGAASAFISSFSAAAEHSRVQAPVENFVPNIPDFKREIDFGGHKGISLPSNHLALECTV